MNFSWMLLGNVVLQLCMWGIISTYVKLGSANDAGFYVLGLAIAQPLFYFTDFNLGQIYVTDVHKRFDFRNYLAHRLLGNIVGVIIGTLIAVSYYHDSRELILVTFLLCIAVAGQTFGEIFHALFQQMDRFDLIAGSMILRGITSLVVVGLVFFSTRSVAESLLALIFARFAVVLLYDYPVSVFMTGGAILPRFAWKSLWELTLLGFPLAATVGILSFVPQIPRLFLKEYADISSAGRFGAMAALMSVGLILVNSLGASMTQRFAKSYAEGNRREFLRLTLVLSGTTFCGGCLALLLIPWIGESILTIAYSRDFAPLNDVFWLITFGASFGLLGNSLGFPVTAARMFKVQPVICFLQMIVTFLGCMLLVPKYGMHGASVSVAASNILMAICFFLVWRNAWRKMKCV